MLVPRRVSMQEILLCQENSNFNGPKNLIKQNNSSIKKISRRQVLIILVYLKLYRQSKKPIKGIEYLNKQINLIEYTNINQFLFS